MLLLDRIRSLGRPFAASLAVLYTLGLLVTLVHLSSDHFCSCWCHDQVPLEQTSVPIIIAGHHDACDHGLNLHDHCDRVVTDFKAPVKSDRTLALLPGNEIEHSSDQHMLRWIERGPPVFVSEAHPTTSRAPPGLLLA